MGLNQCAPLLDKMVSEKVTGQTDHISGWSPQNPSQHLFQSVYAVTHEGNPPDAIAAVIAAPTTAGVCDGAAVQVFPLGQDCASVQKAVENGGRLTGMLLNSRIMADANGARLFLLPGFNNTCIIVAVDSYLQAPR